MEKTKNKDLLNLIHEHTHLKNEDGDDVPFFCFVHDIVDTVDFDMSEEQIAQVALDNGYKVYKAFPEETMIGGLILCAEGCFKEAIDKMYEEFYGEVPTIEEWPEKELTEEQGDEDTGDLSTAPVKKLIDYLFNLIKKQRGREPVVDGNFIYVIYDDISGVIGVDASKLKTDLSGIWEILEVTVDWKIKIYAPNPKTIQDLELIGKKPHTYFILGKNPISIIQEYADFSSDFAIDLYDTETQYKIKVKDLFNEGKEKDPRLVNAGVSGYNQPKRTPNHPTKSHIVVAKEGDKIKTIRFGEQGAKTAGKPKKDESERMKAKRKSFKARHAKNIKKGKMSAAYWADKVKW
jgi:hypothetical protein